MGWDLGPRPAWGDRTLSTGFKTTSHINIPCQSIKNSMPKHKEADSLWLRLDSENWMGWELGPRPGWGGRTLSTGGLTTSHINILHQYNMSILKKSISSAWWNMPNLNAARPADQRKRRV